MDSKEKRSAGYCACLSVELKPIWWKLDVLIFIMKMGLVNNWMKYDDYDDYHLFRKVILVISQRHSMSFLGFLLKSCRNRLKLD
jgi:hypothetical protein